MDASSSSSSSFPLPIKSYSEPLLLTSLPEDGLMRITQRVSAIEYYDDIASLQSVSRQFRRLSNEPMVLRLVSNFVIQSSIWSHSPARRMKLQACIECGNTEALFTQGNTDFFSLIKKRGRIGALACIFQPRTSEINLSLWDIDVLSRRPRQKKGMQVLSTLMDPLQVSRSMDITGKLHRKTVNRFWLDSYGVATLPELKQMYV